MAIQGAKTVFVEKASHDPREESVPTVIYVDLNATMHFALGDVTTQYQNQTELPIEPTEMMRQVVLKVVSDLRDYLAQVDCVALCLMLDGDSGSAKERTSYYRSIFLGALCEFSGMLSDPHATASRRDLIAAALPRSDISPGTELMRMMEEALVEFAAEMSHLLIEISGSDEPGEGEHKIVDRIAHSDYPSDVQIVIVSPDCDVPLMCLTCYRPNVIIWSWNMKTRTFDQISIEKLLQWLIEDVPASVVNALGLERIALDFACLLKNLGSDVCPAIGNLTIEQLRDSYAHVMTDRADEPRTLIHRTYRDQTQAILYPDCSILSAIMVDSVTHGSQEAQVKAGRIAEGRLGALVGIKNATAILKHLHDGSPLTDADATSLGIQATLICKYYKEVWDTCFAKYGPPGKPASRQQREESEAKLQTLASSGPRIPLLRLLLSTGVASANIRPDGLVAFIESLFLGMWRAKGAYRGPYASAPKICLPQLPFYVVKLNDLARSPSRAASPEDVYNRYNYLDRSVLNGLRGESRSKVDLDLVFLLLVTDCSAMVAPLGRVANLPQELPIHATSPSVIEYAEYLSKIDLVQSRETASRVGELFGAPETFYAPVDRSIAAQIIAQDLFDHAQRDQQITTLRKPINHDARFFSNLVIDFEVILARAD